MNLGKEGNILSLIPMALLQVTQHKAIKRGNLNIFLYLIGL